MSHHKRLAISSRLTSPEIFLNCVFLLLIGILSITNDLLGNYGNAGDVVVLYAVGGAAGDAEFTAGTFLVVCQG